MTMKIHPTAVVDPGAKLGRDVEVGPFSYIEGRVEIGDGCVIGPHVTIREYTTLGAGCRVHAGAVIGDLPQDLGFKGGESYVRVGPNCLIRENVTIHRGSKPGTATEVGESCFLMAGSHCAHNVRLGSRVILANGVLLAGYVEVGERAFLSGNSMVHQFARVGRVAMLGGGSGATKDVPPFCTLRVLMESQIGGLNVVGMRRAGMGDAERLAVKRVFGILFRSGLNVSQAVERIKAEYPSGPGAEMATFIEQSKRGICAYVPVLGDDPEA